MSGMSGHEALGGRDHGGDRGLHVGGAAPVQVAVALHGHEGIAGPAVDWAGRHDVDVAGETDDRGDPTVPRPKITDAPAIDALAGKSRGR